MVVRPGFVTGLVLPTVMARVHHARLAVAFECSCGATCRGDSTVLANGQTVCSRRRPGGVGPYRTEPRFTRDIDIDIVVAVANDDEAEQLIREAGLRGYRPFMLLEHDVAKRIATVRLQSDSGVLDLLFASSGIEPEVVAAAEVIALLPGLSTPVACVADLMALKLLARDPETRPQDDIDLGKLGEVAAEADSARK
jgi:hypothetical protein